MRGVLVRVIALSRLATAWLHSRQHNLQNKWGKGVTVIKELWEK